MPTRIVIVGGGFGGLVAATELAGGGGDRLALTVVDRKPRFAMGLTKSWVAVGRRKAEDCYRQRDRLARQGVGFVCEEVRGLDVEKREVVTGSRRLPYDRLILAPGLSVVPEAVPGLIENGIDLYRMSGAEEARQALSELHSGRVLIAVCAPPFKCPPAPYEAAMLVAEYLKGRATAATIEIATFEPRPVPLLPPDVGAAIAGYLAERGIALHTGHKLARVEPKKAFFENGTEMAFDLLLAVPPHRPRVFLRDVPGLTDESGMILVDPKTLATQIPGVYGIGDGAKVTIPAGNLIPRAGVFAEGQAKVVAANLLAELSNRPERLAFDGVGTCFVEVGQGLAAATTGRFFAEGGPTAQVEAPSTEGLRLKVEFEASRLRSWFGTS